MSIKIKVIENFITQDQCKYLINYAKDQNLWDRFNNAVTSYNFKNKEEHSSASEQWDGRRVDINELYKEGMENRKDKIDLVLPLNKFDDPQIWSSDLIYADKVYRIHNLFKE